MAMSFNAKACMLILYSLVALFESWFNLRCFSNSQFLKLCVLDRTTAPKPLSEREIEAG